jgi:NCS1 family nucleobase:cation symporter-1
MFGAIALVVSYFSGPMLNFGDFARYGKSFQAVKRGNLWGLPINFLFFSLLTVITASATVPVFGELITDPIKTVERIDTPFAILLGGLTFVTATVGINIVANFISPAFDFSNVAPKRISWRAGGMIAAVGSTFLMPWNWYSNSDAIHYSLGVLGALIGPLFGILIAGYYIAARQRVKVDAMFTMDAEGPYWYRNGFNPNGVKAVIAAGVPTVAIAVFPKLFADLGLFDIAGVSDYSWFIGCGLGFVLFLLFERLDPRVPTFDGESDGISDGTVDGAAATAASEPPAISTGVPVLARTAPGADAPVPGSGDSARDAGAVLAQTPQDAGDPERGTTSTRQTPVAGPREATA